MPVIPPPPRHAIEDLGTSLKISIPSRKHWFVIPFLGFWLIGWAFGEIVVGGTLLAGFINILFGKSLESSGIEPAACSGVGLFLLAWLGIWTVGGAFTIYAFLWQLAGKEIVEVSLQSITTSRQVLGFSRPKEYLAEHIKDLRVAPPGNGWFGWPRATSFWGLSGGSVAFDYGARTFRFGSGADEAEAKQIIAAIQQRFPQYRAQDEVT
jgi:hypothetical protein